MLGFLLFILPFSASRILSYVRPLASSIASRYAICDVPLSLPEKQLVLPAHYFSSYVVYLYESCIWDMYGKWNPTKNLSLTQIFIYCLKILIVLIFFSYFLKIFFFLLYTLELQKLRLPFTALDLKLRQNVARSLFIFCFRP